MKVGLVGAEWANFFAETKEVFSIHCTNRRKGKFFGPGLRGVAIVGFDDAAELLLASNAAGELGPEGFVQNLVVRADTPMRA